MNEEPKGKRVNQITESKFIDGHWNVRIWMKIETSDDLETWEGKEFECEANGNSFDKAFEAAISGVMDYLYAEGENEQSLLEDN